MKRKRTTDWRKKLDQAGPQFLEGYRVANAIRHELADTPEAQQAIEEVARLLPGFRETKKVQITPELLKRLQDAGSPFIGLHAGQMDLPPNAGTFLEIFNATTEILEQAPPGVIPSAVAFAGTLVASLYRTVKTINFGSGPIGASDAMWAVGTTLELMGSLLKGKTELKLGKGRINTELVDVIRAIRKHQLKRLKTREVLEILTYVGIHVPDEEGLRVFEWRARKKGLL